ncbi:MAG TPA: hypothetical protein DDW50_21095 [Firmicutes bacterium]|jgi:hypothetical protein|nr:hypothetical protein [Bacillota bacterium]
MKDATKFEDLPKSDQIDCFIQHVSGHEKEAEILYILAIYAAYLLTNENAEKYNLTEYTSDELVNLFENADGFDEEERAWNSFIDSIGTSQIWDIISNPIPYIDELNKITNLIQNIKYRLFKNFAHFRRKEMK